MPKVQAVCSVSRAVFAVSIRVPSAWMEFLHPICSQVFVLWLVPHSGAGGPGLFLQCSPASQGLCCAIHHTCMTLGSRASPALFLSALAETPKGKIVALESCRQSKEPALRAEYPALALVKCHY